MNKSMSKDISKFLEKLSTVDKRFYNEDALLSALGTQPVMQYTFIPHGLMFVAGFSDVNAFWIDINFFKDINKKIANKRECTSMPYCSSELAEADIDFAFDCRKLDSKHSMLTAKRWPADMTFPIGGGTGELWCKLMFDDFIKDQDSIAQAVEAYRDYYHSTNRKLYLGRSRSWVNGDMTTKVNTKVAQFIGTNKDVIFGFDNLSNMFLPPLTKSICVTNTQSTVRISFLHQVVIPTTKIRRWSKDRSDNIYYNVEARHKMLEASYLTQVAEKLYDMTTIQYLTIVNCRSVVEISFNSTNDCKILVDNFATDILDHYTIRQKSYSTAIGAFSSQPDINQSILDYCHPDDYLSIVFARAALKQREEYDKNHSDQQQIPEEWMRPYKQNISQNNYAIETDIEDEQIIDKAISQNLNAIKAFITSNFVIQFSDDNDTYNVT